MSPQIATPGAAQTRARFLKEHVYASFTGLAVLTAVALDGDHATAWDTITILAVAVVGISLAGLVSEVVSHQIAHGSPPDRQELLTMARIAAGALGSASIAFAVLFAAAATLVPVLFAIYLSVGIYFVTLLVTSYIASLRTGVTPRQRFGYLGVLVGLGVLVILMLVLAHTL